MAQSATLPADKTAAALFESELDSSALTRPMWMLWILSAGLIALDGFDFFIIGIAMPFIQRDFGLSAGWVGAIATAALAGALVGSLTLGPITDKVGRQLMLVVDIGLFVIASAATALAWNAWSLLIFRFLVGVGIGADYPISVAYITENVPARRRGQMVIGAFSFQSIGALLGALVGWVTIYGFQQIAPALAITQAWRWMLGVGIILSLLVGGLRLLFLLESPSYYLAKGNYEAASKAASQLLEKTIHFEPESLSKTEAEEIRTERPKTEGTRTKEVRAKETRAKEIRTKEAKETANKEQLNYSDLFAPTYRKQTALASIPWFLQDIATYGIGIFTPAIIAALVFSSEGDFLMQEMTSAKGAAIANSFLVVGFIFAILLISKIGRIPLQIIGFCGMAAGLGILSFAGNSLTLLFSGFILFNLMMNLGPNSTTFLLSGEVFPPAIRASGAGLAGGIAKSGAVLGALCLPILQETIGIEGVVRSLALICLLAAIITYSLRSAATIKPSLE